MKKKFNFLEVGTGSTDQNLKSALPSHCKSGATLRAFRDYFTNASIYGCNIDKKILFKYKRIFTFYLDQTLKRQCENFFKKLNKNFLIIIDDGLHEFKANINLFETAKKYLQKGGLYIIEDINEFKLDGYYLYFLRYKNKFRVNFYNIYNYKFRGKSNYFILLRNL